MPKTRSEKEELVQKIAESLAKSKSVVFADYKGLNMAQLTELRQKLAETGAKFTVTKNNLLKIALKNRGVELDEKIWEGPIATLFSFEDQIIPIKVLAKAFKDNQMGKVKAGILDGEVMDEVKINQLAQLPSKDELRAKVVGSLGAPLYGIVGVLQANIKNLVYALDQVRISRGGV